MLIVIILSVIMLNIVGIFSKTSGHPGAECPN